MFQKFFVSLQIILKDLFKYGVSTTKIYNSKEQCFIGNGVVCIPQNPVGAVYFSYLSLYSVAINCFSNIALRHYDQDLPLTF